MSTVNCPDPECRKPVRPIAQPLDAAGKKRRFVIPPHHSPVKNPTRNNSKENCSGSGKEVVGYKPPADLIG